MLLQKKQKGQGLVEFALILPVLLLLLLGIIEGSRVIWAYVTVQTAAREATRFAVVGRPFLDTNQLGSPTITGPICNRDQGSVEPDSFQSGVQPWFCTETQRAAAISQVAMNRGRT